MTTNDIISHRWSASQFYATLKPTTIAEASKEPLKLCDLKKMTNKEQLSNGSWVDYSTALCFYCLQNLMGKYHRSKKPDSIDTEYMAKQISNEFPDWSVLDLPTFVHMCIMARIPSVKYGATEYELISLDIPSIMGKLESYDKMRPNPRALQGGSPQRVVEKPLTEYQMTHKWDGTEYQWPDEKSCWLHWKSTPDFSNPSETEFREKVSAKVKETGKKFAKK